MTVLDRLRRTSAAVGAPSAPVPTPSARRIPYEPALDGLRGVAVAAVVLYHADLVYGGRRWMGAGFLGVDAFFVLSGFLITALLLVEREADGAISLRGFWSRRARRLLPALFAVVGAVALYAAWEADPTEYERIRSHGLASLFYATNWQLITEEVSYFTQFETPSPFQHLWSLAIEEQWYLIWPVVVGLVLAARRGSARTVMWLSIGGALVSAAVMAVLAEGADDPSRAYFGTDARAQSLLVGAAISSALISGVRVPDWVARRLLPLVAAAAGLALAAVWLLGDWTTGWYYRGGFLLFATTAGLVIVAGVQPEGNVVRRALSIRPLTALGAISYGVYLWHWPLFFVLDAQRFPGWSDEAILAVRLAATLAVSTLSYVVLERPIRQGVLSRHFRLTPVFVPVSIAVLAVALVATTTAAPSRPTLATADAPEESIQLPTRDDLALGMDPTTRPMPDEAVTTEATKVLVLGDSVAYTMANGFTDEVQAAADLLVWNQTVLFCELAEGPRLENGLQVQASDTCADRGRTWRKNVRVFEPDLVLLQVGAWEIFNRKIDGEWLEFGSGAFNAYFTAVLHDTIDTLTAEGATVVLLTTPHFERSDAMSAREWTQNETWRTTHINELFAEVAGERDDTVLLPLASWLCPDGETCIHELVDGTTVRYDGVHFSDAGAVAAAQWLAPQLRAVAAATGDPEATTDRPEATTTP